MFRVPDHLLNKYYTNNYKSKGFFQFNVKNHSGVSSSQKEKHTSPSSEPQATIKLR